jgi:hypothetical protein
MYVDEGASRKRSAWHREKGRRPSRRPPVTRPTTSEASATGVFDENIKTLTENGIHKCEGTTSGLGRIKSWKLYTVPDFVNLLKGD